MKKRAVELLLKADHWMPTQVLQDKLGIRSQANMNITMKELETDGLVVHQKRFVDGLQITEWRHADRADVEAFSNGRIKKKAAITAAKSKPPAEPEVTPESHTADLRKKIEEAEAKANDLQTQVNFLEANLIDAEKRLKYQIESAERIQDHLNQEGAQAQRANDMWMKLAEEFGCSSIPELRAVIKESASAKANSRLVPPALPFSVTEVAGYHLNDEKLTLFTNKRLSSKSVTFNVKKLAKVFEMATQ